MCCVFVRMRRPPRSTRTDTLVPYTTLFRSPVAAARVGIEIAPDEPHFLDAALQLGDRVLRRAARRLGKLADRREIAGIEVAAAPDEIVADPRPLAAHLLVADVIAHAAGPGREDGDRQSGV